jgi:hypothetical protein
MSSATKWYAARASAFSDLLLTATHLCHEACTVDNDKGDLDDGAHCCCGGVNPTLGQGLGREEVGVAGGGEAGGEGRAQEHL